MSRFSLIFVAADASHLWTCGSTAAAKAQPSAQDFAQSVPAPSSLAATVAALFPAWPSHESPFAGSAFHAYLSMPWTRGTVIWLTMPLNARSKFASLHPTWWYRRSLPCFANPVTDWTFVLTAAMVDESVVVAHVPNSAQRFCARA